MKLGFFLRGLCMGIADVIPGVSGGTMALVLGIYSRFINALKSLNPKPVIAAGRWLASGGKRERRQELIVACDSVDWRFLVPLGAGILTAMAVGSAVIPKLMDDYPAQMRGLFFGLILASVGVPYRMMPKKQRADQIVGLITGIALLLFGYFVTDPNRQVDTVSNWVAVASETPQDLKSLCREGPSAASTASVYWAERNDSLREAHAQADPEAAAILHAMHANEKAMRGTDKAAEKSRSAPYDAVEVPAGTSVHLPRPSFAFIFLAGLIAISAMILPGISGSFLLLILGCYYFVLNAIKGTLSALLHLNAPGDGLFYVGLFVLGCVVGLTMFSRVLNFLLIRLPAPTMAGLVGLMLGCLRGVWPWRAETAAGEVVNVWAQGPAFWPAFIICLCGMAIALAIEFLGRRRAEASH